jgi:hypothetical protein
MKLPKTMRHRIVLCMSVNVEEMTSVLRPSKGFQHQHPDYRACDHRLWLHGDIRRNGPWCLPIVVKLGTDKASLGANPGEICKIDGNERIQVVSCGKCCNFQLLGNPGGERMGSCRGKLCSKRQFAAEIIVNAHIWMQVANQLAK